MHISICKSSSMSLRNLSSFYFLISYKMDSKVLVLDYLLDQNLCTILQKFLSAVVFFNLQVKVFKVYRENMKLEND